MPPESSALIAVGVIALIVAAVVWLHRPQPSRSAKGVPVSKPLPPAPPVPTGDDFGLVHAVIAKWEGGFSHHPRDPGGATNFGITIGVLKEWRKLPVTVADVKALSYAEALEIFRARYWTPLKCSQLHKSIALMTYNAGVNSGIGRGALWLQECLNKQGVQIAEDGKIGPKTLEACRRADVVRLISDYANRYERFYRSLSTFSTFGRGWLNRLKDVKGQALQWASAQIPPPSKDAQPILLPDRLDAALKRKNYVRFTQPGEINILAVEGLYPNGQVNGDAPDRWNDSIYCLTYDDAGDPVLLDAWEATTEPGRYYTVNPVNPKGAARIEFGQYRSFIIDLHRGKYEALCQMDAPRGGIDGRLAVRRDANKDMMRPGDRLDTGHFGINVHWGHGAGPDSVGRASAGCLVIRKKTDFDEFMRLIKSDPRYGADPDFVYTVTVLAERDVVPA